MAGDRVPGLSGVGPSSPIPPACRCSACPLVAGWLPSLFRERSSARASPHSSSRIRASSAGSAAGTVLSFLGGLNRASGAASGELDLEPASASYDWPPGSIAANEGGGLSRLSYRRVGNLRDLRRSILSESFDHSPAPPPGTVVATVAARTPGSDPSPARQRRSRRQRHRGLLRSAPRVPSCASIAALRRTPGFGSVTAR